MMPLPFSEALPATEFDRLRGVPAGDRRPYNLIVEGQGDILLRKHRRRLKQAGADAASAEPRSHIARRYIDGVRLLTSLGLNKADPASPKAEKPSVVVLTSRTARSLTIVFSGNNTEFALPAHLLLHQDTHLVLIHDRQRCFGLAGLGDLGADYASSLASLSRIIENLQPEAVYLIGISAGGAGAIKFACDLHAQRLLCFSVPTTLKLEDDDGATLARYPQLARLYRHDRSLGIDLGAYYAAHAHAPPATLVYSPGHPRDSWLALRMAGLPGVTLVPTEGFTGHATYRWLTHQDAIGSYLDALYEPLATVPAARVPGPALLFPAVRDDRLSAQAFREDTEQSAPEMRLFPRMRQVSGE